MSSVGGKPGKGNRRHLGRIRAGVRSWGPLWEAGEGRSATAALLPNVFQLLSRDLGTILVGDRIPEFGAVSLIDCTKTIGVDAIRLLALMVGASILLLNAESSQWRLLNDRRRLGKGLGKERLL